jgi:hypothetical protein
MTIYAYDLDSGRYLYQNAVNDKGDTCGKCHKDEPVLYHQKGDDTDQWLVSHDKVDEYMTTEFYDEKDHFGYSFSDTESWDLAAYIYYVMLQNSEINEPPTADAGPDQTVNEGNIVILNGSNSSDPDDGIASYQWTQTAGTSITLSDSTVAQPTFTTPYVAASGEALVFDLTVTDNGGLQDTDTCIVNVIPLSAPGTIYGIVTDKETGEPISGAIISAMCKDVGKKKTSTNASGYYDLTDLEDGEWTVKVRCKGYKSTTAIVNVSSGGTYEQNFELLPR